MHKLAILFLWGAGGETTGQQQCVCDSYIASMVGAGEQLACSHSGDVVESSGLLAAAVRRPLQHVHQVSNEEVILQCRHTLLRQDRGLAAHGARQCEAVGRDVILQAPGREQQGKLMSGNIV